MKSVIFKYICYLLGFDSIDDFRQVYDNHDNTGQISGYSDFYEILVLNRQLKINPELLARYDTNIARYMDRINQKRAKSIELKYFQYLAVLFTEIYLDRFFNQKNQLLTSLNEFIGDLNKDKDFMDPEYILKIKSEDLEKIAYWMATGSGKTYILHINYLQFLTYCNYDIDNILLITANEDLSYQHHNELYDNGIDSTVFDGTDRLDLGRNQILIIDIHKLKEETGRKTIAVESFDGNNLVFVDEADLGMGGSKWMELRRQISEDGFVFEYSATFGQSIKNNQRFMEEYSKSIIFDYSYYYFYKDGYGKDFEVLNVPSNDRGIIKRVMVANVLSFYEKNRYFNDHPDIMSQYNLEKPLWIFVGHKVVGTSSSNYEDHSDISMVLELLNEVISDRQSTIDIISDILSSKTSNVYDDMFDYLRSFTLSSSDLFEEIMSTIFHAPNGSASALDLYLVDNDEIGIKLKDASQYFGVINIGDVRGFRKLVSKVTSLTIDTDNISDPLFQQINTKDTTISLLIGSKKFIHGWDTWRVTNMGLLNIARSAGPQVIQLFGRGVRLLGRKQSLQRSWDLHQSPPYLRVMETLSIFGIKADYMQRFREILENEDIPIENREPRKRSKSEIARRPVDHEDFKSEIIRLDVDASIHPTINLYADIEMIQSSKSAEVQYFREKREVTDLSYLQYLDYDRLYFHALEFISLRGYNNLIVEKSVIKNILQQPSMYTLYCPSWRLELNSFSDLSKIEEIAEIIVERYIEEFYTTKFTKQRTTRPN